MPTRRKMNVAAKFVEEWTLPPAATLGSSVRAKGIVLEVRAHLPLAVKRLLDIEVAVLTMTISGPRRRSYPRRWKASKACP